MRHIASKLTLAVLAMATLTTSCATLRRGMNGRNIHPDLARSVGCNPEHLNAAIDFYIEEGRSRYVPEVGWPVCKLLVETGGPYDIDRQTSEYGKSMNFWYRTGSDVSMVTLEPGGTDGGWYVTYVGW